MEIQPVPILAARDTHRVQQDLDTQNPGWSGCAGLSHTVVASKKQDSYIYIDKSRKYGLYGFTVLYATCYEVQYKQAKHKWRGATVAPVHMVYPERNPTAASSRSERGSKTVCVSSTLISCCVFSVAQDVMLI